MSQQFLLGDEKLPDNSVTRAFTKQLAKEKKKIPFAAGACAGAVKDADDINVEVIDDIEDEHNDDIGDVTKMMMRTTTNLRKREQGLIKVHTLHSGH